VDALLRLKLADLEPIQFEKFFLNFFATHPELTVLHHGRRRKRRVATATTYAAGSGRKDRGVDVRLEMEGGEIWAVQCKRVETWNASKTQDAIAATHEFQAKHYILAVACDVGLDVHDEIAKHGTWTLWNLDTICTEFRQRVPLSLQQQCLPFLSPAELAQFIPYATDALISPERFFKGHIGRGSGLRHDWKLVGRQENLRALVDFVAAEEPDKPRVLLLTARGGQGKSRLLFELSRRLEQEPAGRFEIVFLNPASTDDRPERGLVPEAGRLVVLVDDAHRVENVPRWLLEWVRQDPKARVILAARPQGREAVRGALQDAGVNPAVPEVELHPLTGKEVRELATEVLGETAADRVAALQTRTKDSPFLTVVAGELLRDGRIDLPADISDDDFRRRVLHVFEALNIQSIPEPDRERSKALLRLVAVLSPVENSPEFSVKAARCLHWNAFDVATALDRLRNIELVVGEDDKLRVVPDLFSDFLVYDLCYGADGANRLVIDGVLREFADAGPVILRNLAEAAWLARRDGKEDPKFMSRLLEAEWARFEAAGFGKRADIIRHWVPFGVFLPSEALDLARRAIDLTTASEEPEQNLGGWLGRHKASHATVLWKLTGLLEPLALSVSDDQRTALDLLWELGFVADWKAQPEGRKYAWAAIANVVGLRKWKGIEIALSALQWLEEKLGQPESLRMLESSVPILRMILEPCFEWTVETVEQVGSTTTETFWDVPAEITQPVRIKVVEILRKVIREGSWMAALAALSAAVPGIGTHPTPYVDPAESDEARHARWRTERLRVLDLFREAVRQHRHFVVQYRVRTELLSVAAFEADDSVRAEVSQLVAEVALVPDLVLANLILAHGALTLEELQAGRPPDDAARKAFEDQKRLRVEAMIHGLLAEHGSPARFLEVLARVMKDLIKAGENPTSYNLYHVLARVDSAFAGELAKGLLEMEIEEPMARGWPLLVESNPSLQPAFQAELLLKGARSRNGSIRSELVDHIHSLLRASGVGLTAAHRELVEVSAVDADHQTTRRLLSFIRGVPPMDRTWAGGLLLQLPLRDVAQKDPDLLIEAVASQIDPEHSGPSPHVSRILSLLVHAPTLRIAPSEAWDRLRKTHAKDIYHLVADRIEAEGRTPERFDYRAIPKAGWSEFRLPELQADAAFPRICEELWERVTNPGQRQWHRWVELFQAVVTSGPSEWFDEFRERVGRCKDPAELSRLICLLRFDGSLVIFASPALTRDVLERIRQLQEQSQHQLESRHQLYRTAGPRSRVRWNGRLREDDDYVEAAAIRAAEEHAEDPVLGPFYRWIVEMEESERLRNEARHRKEMAAMENE